MQPEQSRSAASLLRCVACGELFCRCTGGPTASVVSASPAPVVTVTMDIRMPPLDIDGWLREEGLK